MRHGVHVVALAVDQQPVIILSFTVCIVQQVNRIVCHVKVGPAVTDARSLLLKSYVTAAFRAVSVTENCRATHSQTDEGRLKQLQCQCHTIVIATTVLLIHHKTEGMRD